MNKQKNRGITLIALVITIVILVILVGVSVSVSINTGLIENSKKVVADYDKAQKDEEKIILDTYFTINAAQKNVDLDMREGILIISPEVPVSEIVNTVGEVLSGFPDGYGIGNVNGEKITNNGDILYTGMTILDDKDNIVGRIAVLGDIDGDMNVTVFDTLEVSNYIAGLSNDLNDDDYEKVAMDVNRDGKINQTDIDMVLEMEDARTTFPDEGYRGSIDDIVIEELES